MRFRQTRQDNLWIKTSFLSWPRQLQTLHFACIVLNECYFKFLKLNKGSNSERADVELKILNENQYLIIFNLY